MPPALAPLPHDVLKKVLILDGWEVSAETPWNVELFKGDREIQIPRKGPYVDFETMNHCLKEANLTLGELWPLLDQVGYSYYSH